MDKVDRVVRFFGSPAFLAVVLWEEAVSGKYCCGHED